MNHKPMTRRVLVTVALPQVDRIKLASRIQFFCNIEIRGNVLSICLVSKFKHIKIANLDIKILIVKEFLIHNVQS